MKSNFVACLFLCLIHFTKGMREVNIIDGNLVVNGSDGGTVRIIFVACKVPAQNTILFENDCAPKLPDGESLSDVADNFNQNSQDYTFGDFEVPTEVSSLERPMTDFGYFDKHIDYYLSYQVTCPEEECISSFYVERMPVPGLPMPTPFFSPPPIPSRTPPPMEPTEKPTELPCLCDFEYESGDTVVYSSGGDISALRDMTGVVQCGTHMFDAVLVTFDGYTNGQNGGDNFCDCGNTGVEREISMDYVLCQDIDHVSCPQLNIEHSDTEIDCANTHASRTCDGGVIGCETGYRLNPLKPVISYCNDVGEWLEPFPECERIRCTSPEIENSNSNEACDGIPSGELCPIECDHGYMFDPEIQQALFCNHDGTWSPPLPQCIEDPCADVDCSQENPAGQCEIQSVCHDGNCPPNESSTGNACDDIDPHTIDDICHDGECIGTVSYCGLLAIQNSVTACDFTLTSHPCDTLNGEDEVLCINGYILNAENPIIPFCQEDGSWFDPLPECVEVIHCDDLYIENSVNEIDCTRNTEANNFCDLNTITCAEGFILIPENEVPLCSHEGTWENLPECVPDLCFDIDCSQENPAGQCEIQSSCSEGECQENTPNTGNTCNDGNPNTIEDTCDNGVCIGTEIDPCAGIDCSQENPAGQCENQMACSEGSCPDNTPNTGDSCNDNDSDTNDDTCEQGVCMGRDPCEDIDCSIRNPAGQCEHQMRCGNGICPHNTPKTGDGCDDNNRNTNDDTCDGGVCIGCTIGYTIDCRNSKKDVTHTEAKSFCEAENNSRLCTRNELANDITAGRGCGFDFHLIWSSTECGNNRFWAEYGEQDNAGDRAAECLLQNETQPRDTIGSSKGPTQLVVRCCEDSENDVCRDEGTDSTTT